MTRKVKSILLTALMMFSSLFLMAQKPADLVGTWIGMATLEGEAEANELTLVLTMEDGKLAGHMTDQYATFNENPIEEVTLENNSFNFIIKAESPQGELTVKFSMTVSGDSMEGTLEIVEMGAAGTWEATKQK